MLHRLHSDRAVKGSGRRVPAARVRRCAQSSNLERLEDRTLLSPPTISATLGIAAVDPGAYTDVTPIPGNQAEEMVAINPTDPANIIVAPMDLTAEPNTDVLWVSRDAGMHWTPEDIPVPPGTTASDGAPSIVFDRSGNAVYAHLTTAGGGSRFVSAAVSSDGGMTWTAAAVDGPAGVSDSRPFLAVGPDTGNPSDDRYYLAWTWNGNVYLSSSTNGTTWSDATRVRSGAKNLDAHPAVGPDGMLYLVWEDDSTPGRGKLMFTTSSDGGTTFSTPKIIYTSKINALAGDFIPAQPDRGISMALSSGVDQSFGPERGRFYVAFTDAPSSHDDTNIYVMSTQDAGTTFSPPVEVNDDGGANSQFLASLSVDPTTGAVGVSWYDARNDLGNGIAPDSDHVPNDDVQFVGAVSIDGGTSFLPNLLLSSPFTFGSNAHAAGPFNFGDYTGSTFFGGSFFPTWAANDAPVQPPPTLPPTDVFSDRIHVLETVTANEPGDSTLYIRMAPSGSLAAGITSDFVQFYEDQGTSALLGVPTFTATLSSLDQIIVNNTDGQGLKLVVDFSYGNPIPAGGLVVNGNSIASSLTLQGTLPPSLFPFAYEVDTAAGPGAGTIQLAQDLGGNSYLLSAITYSGLQPIVDTVPVPSFTFQPPLTADVVNLIESTTPGQAEINSGDTTPAFEQVDFANKDSVTVDALTPAASNVQLIVDFSKGNPIPDGGLSDLGVPGGNNSLVLQGTPPSGPFTSETNTALGPGAGTIDLDGSLITFSDLAPITDTVPADEYTFQAPDGGATVVLADASTSGQWELRSVPTSAEFETVDFAGKSHVTIDGGNGGLVGNMFNVLDTPKDITTTINMNGPGATVAAAVNVEATTGPLEIDDDNDAGNSTTPDTVTLGYLDGTVQGIKGMVTLGEDAKDKDDLLIVDDGTDPADHTSMTLGTGPVAIGNNPVKVYSTLAGLAPASINYSADDLLGPVAGLQILAGPGNNTLTVDFSGGNPIPDLSYDGGPANDADTNSLVLQGTLPAGNSFQRERVTMTGADSGSVALVDATNTTSTITFTHLRPITDTVTIAGNGTTKVTLPAAATAVNVNNGPVAGGIQTTAIASGDAPPAFETYNFGNKPNVTIGMGGADPTVDMDNPTRAAGLATLTIDTGDAGDTVNVKASQPNITLNVNTQGGDDTVNVTAMGVGSGSTFNLDGGTGTNTLNVDAGGKAPVNVPQNQGAITIDNLTPINYTSFPVNVTNVGEEPLTTDSIGLAATEGLEFTGAVAAFTDAAYVPGSALLLPAASFFSGLINWGDGFITSVTPADVAVQDGTITVSGTHTYSRYGSYLVSMVLDDDGGTNTTIVGGETFTVTELGGASTTAAGVATVADQDLIVDVPGDISTVEGQPFSGVVGSFTDYNSSSTAADFTAQIDWGDGTVTAGTIQQQMPGGPFDVIGAHTYDEETSGTPQTIAVTVTDIAGNDLALASSVQIDGTADVLDAPLESHGAPSIPGVAGEALSETNNGDDPIVATFTDANPEPDDDDFSAETVTIDWGDGTTTAATDIIEQGAGAGVTYSVQGDYAYDEPGDYQITVTIQDAGGSVTVATSEAIVAAAPPPTPIPIPRYITAIEGQAFSTAVGSFGLAAESATATDYIATIDWGDGTVRDAGTIVQSDAGFFDVIGTHTYAEESSHIPITITVSPVGGASVPIDSVATVLDAPLESHGAPSIPGVAGVALSVTNSSVAPIVATFTDANPNFDPTDFSAPDAAEIDWGDGRSSYATSIMSQGSPAGITYFVRGDHTYYRAGDYQITVTITDAGGSVTVATSEAIITQYKLTAAGASANLPEGVPETHEPIATVIDTNPNADFATTPPSVASENSDISVTNVTIEPVVGSTTAYVVYADLVGDDSGNGSQERDGGGLLITITDANANLVALASSQVYLYDPVLIDPGTAIQAVAGSSFQGKVATFSTTDLQAASSDFTAVVNWGDGQSSDGAIVPTGSGHFLVTGAHTYAGSGTYSVITTIRDDEGQSVADTTTASVSPPQVVVSGLTIAPAHRRTFSGALTRFTSPVPAAAGEFSVLIDWGDGTTSSGRVVAGRKKAGRTAFTVRGTHHYAHRGRYSGTLTIIEHGTAVAAVAAFAVHRPVRGRIASARESAAGSPQQSIVALQLRAGHPEGPLAALHNRGRGRNPAADGRLAFARPRHG